MEKSTIEIMQELFLILSLICSISSNPILNTTSGVYLGREVNYQNRTIEQYLGIQYANIPKRFHRARLIEKQNDTTVSATEFGSICKPIHDLCTTESNAISCSIYYGIFTIKSTPNEQCLFLNIFKPKSDPERKRAVFMWIHGGSGQIGTGNLFDGTVLAALGDFIVITFNFRLNLFGFLSSGDQRLEGNLGLYDQSLVLDWISANLDALGGDSQRLTVGGHSAGAPHAYYLARSSLNQGRIRRLILQSGCPLNIWSHIQSSQAMERFDVVASENQCSIMKTFEEKLQCLEERNFTQLAEHDHPAYNSANHTNVVLHGDLMKHFQEDMKVNQTLKDVDMLIGSNDDEGIYAAVPPIYVDSTDPKKISFRFVNFTTLSLKFLSITQPDKECLHGKALELYHLNRIPLNCSLESDCYCSAFYNYSRLISDLLFDKDYYRFLTQHVFLTNRTYLYHYSYPTSQEHPSPCQKFLSNSRFVGHFAELEYTWGTPLLVKNVQSIDKLVSYRKNTAKNYTHEQVKFSEQLIEYWSNFINNGQPSKDWQTITNLSNGSYMHFQVNQTRMRKFQIPSRIDFWTNTCAEHDNVNDADDLFYEISLIFVLCSSLLLFL